MALVLAALVTALAALGGVALTQRAEARRREHDLQLRQLDHAHEHRERLSERLYADRAAAYRQFTVTFAEHRRRREELGGAWFRREHLGRQLKEVSREEQDAVIKQFDANEAEFRSASQAASAAVVAGRRVDGRRARGVGAGL